MFKKVYNFVTAPVRLVIVAMLMIYAAFELAFNEEERRQYEYDLGNGEID